MLHPRSNPAVKPTHPARPSCQASFAGLTTSALSRGSFLACLFLLWACRGGEPAARADSATSVSTSLADSGGTKAAGNGWNGAAGPALLVQGATRDEAIALFPGPTDSVAVASLDSASLSETPVSLYGRGGNRFTAQLGAPTGEGADGCERWPLHTFQPSDGIGWSVGFVSSHVAPIVLDSVAMFTARDSMGVVAEVSRLASSVTVPTGASFQGLRFTTEDVHRFEATPGVQALVAHVVRRVNQEANPQEEQTLLIAERANGASAGPYSLTYAERAYGREGSVVTPEVLAAIRIGAAVEPVLVIARDSDEGTVYLFLERTAGRRWRVRWSSGMIGCS